MDSIRGAKILLERFEQFGRQSPPEVAEAPPPDAEAPDLAMWYWIAPASDERA
jgi:hypothetical protein